MREKIAQFFGGVMIYSIFGVIMVLVAGKELQGQWPFIIFWTMGMTIAHVFIMEPMRVRMTKKRAERQKIKPNK
ncbi:hypothetical protein AMR72_07160 [Flavobacterium psychrophilum]|nr:hypothetical protein AMR72_07160 [Flavobacterium psychrophilum]AOE52308.1 hypothetical protein ALW18_07150 [Flavobacterium psychrophilum]